MKQHSLDIVAFLRNGAFDKALLCADEANRFGATISSEIYTVWLSLLRQQLYQLLPYASCADIPVKDSTLCFKTENFATQLVAGVSSVFQVLNCKHEHLDSAILLYSILYTPLDTWIQLCDDCLAENELSLAQRCCWIAIHHAMRGIGHPSNLDETQLRYLLELWFRRSHIFELQDSINEAISAIEVYSRLFSDLQRRTRLNEQRASLPIHNDPISYQSHERLLEKRRSRIQQQAIPLP